MNLCLDLTRCCPSHCTTCSIWKIKNPKTLDLRWAKKLVSQIDNLSYVYVTGGEPYIVPYIVELAEYVHKLHPAAVWSGATNCISPNTIKVLSKIKDTGISLFVEISLEGNEEEHDRIRGTVGNYKKAMKVIDWCKDNGVPFGVSTITETGENESKRLGVPYKRNLPRYGERYNTKGKGEKQYISNCPALWSLTCTPEGDIYPCEEYSEELYIGNIKNQDLKDMRIKEVRDYIASKKCQPCNMTCYFDRR